MTFENAATLIVAAIACVIAIWQYTKAKSAEPTPLEIVRQLEKDAQKTTDRLLDMLEILTKRTPNTLDDMGVQIGEGMTELLWGAGWRVNLSRIEDDEPPPSPIPPVPTDEPKQAPLNPPSGAWQPPSDDEARRLAETS